MSSESNPKQQLMKDIERDWNSLQVFLSLLNEEQLTTVRDPQGWSVKDHVVHLEAWERSVVFYLQGRSRHEGLGVDEAVYLKGGFDEINDVIYRQHKDRPLEEVMAGLEEVHRQLLAALEPLADADLQKTYRRYQPEETGEGEGPTVYDLIYGNSAGHYAEHQVWMEALFDVVSGG